jgi:hypothetical protein
MCHLTGSPNGLWSNHENAVDLFYWPTKHFQRHKDLGQQNLPHVFAFGDHRCCVLRSPCGFSPGRMWEENNLMPVLSSSSVTTKAHVCIWSVESVLR